MGSGTHCSKIDGFPGTHGTHANGATGISGPWLVQSIGAIAPVGFWKLAQKNMKFGAKSPAFASFIYK